MAATFAELEARMRGVEVRAQRAEEDITAIISTVVEIREEQRWQRRALAALLDHHGLTIAPEDEAAD